MSGEIPQTTHKLCKARKDNTVFNVSFCVRYLGKKFWHTFS